MSNNEEKDSEVKEHYSKWMANADLLKKLKRRIEKVGYPLEAAARKILQDNDYFIDLDKYYAQMSGLEEKELWREIDIVASRTILRKEVDDCAISIDAQIVADCKYSSTNDFFVFETDETSFYRRAKQGLFWQFPIYLPKTNLVIYNSTDSFGKVIQFSSLIDTIAEIDVNKLKVHPEAKTIYEASHQVVNAIAYFAGKQMTGHEDYVKDDEDEKKTMDKVRKAYDSLSKELWEKRVKSVKKVDEITLQMIKEDGNEIGKKLYPDIGSFYLSLWIPMVILGRNNGIFKVITTDDKVKDIEEIKFGLYRFTPSVIPDQFKKSVRARDVFPVVICNLQYLNECLEFLKSKMEGIANLMIDSIIADKEQLVKEYISYAKAENKKV